MGFLKGQVHSAKFTTAEITDADDRIYYVPIKHTIDNYFLIDIENNFYAFDLEGARKLTYRTKTGIGKSFQVIQFDTSNARPLSPTTQEMGRMLKQNSLGKMDRRKHNILSILARREKDNFGTWSVGEEDFEFKNQAEDYLNDLEDKTYTVKDKNGKEVTKQFEVIHNIHDIKELIKVFEAEEGEYPEDVKEIKAYLNGLDVRYITTPLRKITEFITDDLIATKPSFLAEGVARYQRLDGTLREITNYPVKPKGQMMKYMVILMPVIIGALILFIGLDQGWFDGVTDFVDSMGTLGEGLGGLPSVGGPIQRSSTGGVDNSDAAIMSKYPGCETLMPAINDGVVDYNALSTDMKSLVDSCP